MPGVNLSTISLPRLSNMPDVFVSIISGRSLANVQEMVGIEGITYAGNHGLEIIHPDGTKFLHPIPREMEERVGELTEQLQQECCEVRSHSVFITAGARSFAVRTAPGWRTRESC